MLKYRKIAHRPWPVSVTLAECDEASGDVAESEHVFIGHFKPFTEADLLAARLDVFGDESDPAVKQAQDAMPVAEYAVQEARFFGGLMCGWSQVADEAGHPVPYSAAALQGLCTGPDGAAFRRGFNRAVSQIRFGVAPAKNAVTSPSPGPTPAPGEAAPAS